MRHQLTVRVTFEDTDDDVQGRGLALEWLRQNLMIAPPIEGLEVKLHQLRPYGPPKPIKLWEEKP